MGKCCDGLGESIGGINIVKRKGNVVVEGMAHRAPTSTVAWV